MDEQPLVWHYGLMAERWAEFINECSEAPFLLKQIGRFGQPVLDAACGTGRVLLPLLRAGVDIDGNDISADMLHFCRRKAAGEGFHPNLTNQPMHALDLPRKYKTIFIWDSFGLAGGLENDLETLKRCRAALEDGGALLVNIEAEYASVQAWNLWLREQRMALPQPWPEQASIQTAQDGSEHTARFRILDLDPLEQTITRQVRLEKRVNGKTIASEEYTLRGNMYFKNDLLLMLKLAGFQDISVRGDLTDEPATPDHANLFFIAIK